MNYGKPALFGVLGGINTFLKNIRRYNSRATHDRSENHVAGAIKRRMSKPTRCIISASIMLKEAA
jgi:hypothetical protein